MREPIPDLFNETMNLQLERGKPITLFLLNGHNNKLIPNFYFQFPLKHPAG